MKEIASIEKPFIELFSIANKRIFDLTQGINDLPQIKIQKHCDNFNLYWDCLDYCFCKQENLTETKKTPASDLYIKKILLRIIKNLSQIKLLDSFVNETYSAETSYPGFYSADLRTLSERIFGETSLNVTLLGYCKVYLYDKERALQLIQQITFDDHENFLGLKNISSN
jgi:hypothetical protein